MKKLILLLAVVTLSFGVNAQSSKKKNATAKPGFTIAGTVNGAPDGTKVYIAEMQGFFSFIPSDSAVTQNGKFLIKGNQKQPVLRFLLSTVNKDDQRIAQLILENVNITVNLAKDSKDVTVVGGKDNELWKEYNKNEEVASVKINPIWEIARDSTKTQAQRDAAQKQIDEFDKQQTEQRIQFIEQHIPSGVSSILLSNEYSRLDGTRLNKILSLMKAKCPYDEVYRQIIAEREATRRTAIGTRYTDIALKSPEGKLVKVSDFVRKNKVTMIDFWASWCGPCRHEMPNVIKAYNDYKDKGFAVVGVSLDNNLEAWKGAISKLGIPWAQMSDLKGWQSAGAAAYNVKAIPATVLIGQNGKIIAKDLRGDELDAKLKEILK